MCILHMSKHCKLSTRSDQKNNGEEGEKSVRIHLAAWLKAESDICFIFHVLRLILEVKPFCYRKSVDHPEARPD